MAKVTLYNSSENTQIILLNGERVRIEAGKHIEVEAKEVEAFKFLVDSKKLKEIEEARKAARSPKGQVTVGDNVKVKSLEAQVEEMKAQIEALTKAAAKK